MNNDEYRLDFSEEEMRMIFSLIVDYLIKIQAELEGKHKSPLRSEAYLMDRQTKAIALYNRFKVRLGR